MAGLQYCCRKLLIYNTSRLINKNGVLLQPCRRRHNLVFQISSPQARMVFQKSQFLYNKEKKLIYRLASTNVNIPKETVSDVLKPGTHEATNESLQLNSDAGVNGVTSNSNVIIEESLLPPAPMGDITEVPVLKFVSTGLKEPSFESLGLGSWWPSGIVQQIMEFLHINCDLAWWQVILAVTCTCRIFLFPVNLSVKRETIVLMNNMPTVANYQKKITDAKLSGDFYAVASTTHEMQNFMKEKKLNMFSFMKTMLVQGPVFLSMFYGLKGMANLPVESLKTGGLFWFTDLTVPDPYYILPVALSTSLLLMVELGVEATPAKANTHTLKWIMRAVPIVVFAISTRFSSCITLYWTISNMISLTQAGLLKIPAVATFFKLPKLNENAGRQSLSNKGFIEGFKEGFSNARITGQLEDRRRTNLMEFQKAGTSTIPRTFKRNPLVQEKTK